MSWNEAAPAAIIGALVATAGVFIVELWIKPAYARLRVAHILLSEIQLNETTVDRLIALRLDNSEHVPWDAALSTRAWSAVASEVHFLPVDVVAALLDLYAGFDALNALVRENNHRVDAILSMPLSGEGAIRVMDEEVRGMAAIFGNDLAEVQKVCKSLRAHLSEVIAAGPPL